jgi:electron transport complex protein RnfG
MKDFARLVIVLTVICLVAGLMLAWVHGKTEGPIAEARLAAKMAAMDDVLPENDGIDTSQTVSVSAAGSPEGAAYGLQLQLAFKDGAFVGAAFETVTQEGYGGEIRAMVGVTSDGTVNGVRILQHKETPGLGAKVTTPAFLGQFVGKSAANRWQVRKDGGEFDQITAATISSRAVVGAVKAGLDAYVVNLETIKQRADSM